MPITKFVVSPAGFSFPFRLRNASLCDFLGAGWATGSVGGREGNTVDDEGLLVLPEKP